ncbi:MAG: C2 domain-containing protein [Rickettsiales bacterium]
MHTNSISCAVFSTGKKYNLDTDGELPTLHVVVSHKAGYSVSDVPMGELQIDLGTIDHGGVETDLWYPLALSGRMKSVTGEVRCCCPLSTINYSSFTRNITFFPFTGAPEIELQ